MLSEPAFWPVERIKGFFCSLQKHSQVGNTRDLGKTSSSSQACLQKDFAFLMYKTLLSTREQPCTCVSP